MKKKIIRYWDSDCFLGWLNKELDKKENCEYVLDLAENGKVIIVYSAITLTEVIYLRGRLQISFEKHKAIENFFQRSYLRMIDVDRKIANFARELIWKYNVKPKDSIHVATAINRNISILNTFDGGLLKLDGKLQLEDKSKNLTIKIPDSNIQKEIF